MAFKHVNVHNYEAVDHFMSQFYHQTLTTVTNSPNLCGGIMHHLMKTKSIDIWYSTILMQR